MIPCKPNAFGSVAKWFFGRSLATGLLTRLRRLLCCFAERRPAQPTSTPAPPKKNVQLQMCNSEFLEVIDSRCHFATLPIRCSHIVRAVRRVIWIPADPANVARHIPPWGGWSDAQLGPARSHQGTSLRGDRQAGNSMVGGGDTARKRRRAAGNDPVWPDLIGGRRARL